MEFMFYIAAELSPWLSFLSCKVMIFPVEVTASNSDFTETPSKINEVYTEQDEHPLSFTFFPAPVLFYLGFYTTLTNHLDFPVHQPYCRVGQRKEEDNSIVIGNVALACAFWP